MSPMTITIKKEGLAAYVVEHFNKGGAKKYEVDDFESSWERDEHGDEVLVLRLLPYSKRPRRNDDESESEPKGTKSNDDMAAG